MRNPTDQSVGHHNDQHQLGGRGPFVIILLLCGVIAGLGIAMSKGERATQTTAANHDEAALSKNLKSAQQVSKKVVDNQRMTAETFAVSIRKPSGPPTVDTGKIDPHGNAISVACSTCHTTRPPNSQNKTSKDLDEFHVGMPFLHGNISCLSCHNDGDYDALKLADGSRVEFTEVMTLCSQCHGPQKTAYDHGAHGGMTGHWDLTRGPRVKNNCVDCHNPHMPQFPKMQPTFKPKDRFLEKSEH